MSAIHLHKPLPPRVQISVASGLRELSRWLTPRRVQPLGDPKQALVARPQCRTRGQSNGGEKMRIDIANPGACERMLGDELQHFLLRGDDRPRQVLQGSEDKIVLPQISERKLTNHERVRP